MATAIRLEAQNSRRPTSRPSLHLAGPGQAGVLAMIQMILDRSIPYEAEKVRCDCAVCVERRSQAYTCDLCGYVGQPAVWPCDCMADQQHRLRTYSRAARRAAVSHRKEPDLLLTAGKARRMAADCRDAIRDLRRNGGICDPSEPQCAHGCATCPVCSGETNSTWARDEDAGHVFAIIRDVRRVLAGEHASEVEGRQRFTVEFSKIRREPVAEVYVTPQPARAISRLKYVDAWANRENGGFGFSVESAAELRSIAYELLAAADRGVVECDDEETLQLASASSVD